MVQPAAAFRQDNLYSVRFLAECKLPDQWGFREDYHTLHSYRPLISFIIHPYSLCYPWFRDSFTTFREIFPSFRER